AAYVNHAANHFAGAKFFHQLARAVDGRFGLIGIQAFFKFAGSVCPESNPLGRKPDLGSVEDGRLKKHGLHLVGDHGVFTAHDTADAYRFFAVADHQDVFIHGPLLAVQGNKFLSGFRPAHNDLSSFNGIQVVSVHKLSVLFHHIVGDINKVVDGTDAV